MLSGDPANRYHSGQLLTGLSNLSEEGFDA
jgi:hypothetical protein